MSHWPSISYWGKRQSDLDMEVRASYMPISLCPSTELPSAPSIMLLTVLPYGYCHQLSCSPVDSQTVSIISNIDSCLHQPGSTGIDRCVLPRRNSNLQSLTVSKTTQFLGLSQADKWGDTGCLGNLPLCGSRLERYLPKLTLINILAFRM